MFWSSSLLESIASSWLTVDGRSCADAAKTGADQVVDQRQSTRRVVFSSTGWQRKGVPGCQPQQTMPRELRLSNASEAASGNGGA